MHGRKQKRSHRPMLAAHMWANWLQKPSHRGGLRDEIKRGYTTRAVLRAHMWANGPRTTYHLGVPQSGVSKQRWLHSPSRQMGYTSLPVWLLPKVETY